MSLIAKIFGSKGGKAPTPEEAIQKLRETEDMLQKKSDYLEKKVETELNTARKNGTKNKRVALQALKRKKRLEKQLLQIDGALSTIEFQREALENASTNTEVLKSMKQAAQALKVAHQDMDVDNVHDLMDDIHEQQEVANEIADAISNPIGFGQDIDEDELNAELEELAQQDLDEKLLEVGDLPSVPVADVPVPAAAAKSKAKDEDDELAQLADWAS